MTKFHNQRTGSFIIAISFCLSNSFFLSSGSFLFSGGMKSVNAENPHAFLAEYSEPYYPGTTFPKLTTPQWVGEHGVDAVVTLAIDDMRDPALYET